MPGIVILGSLSTNNDPSKRIQVFEAAPVVYTSLEGAIQAAKNHYSLNFGQGRVPQFRVYQSTDPDGATYAIVEVTEGPGDMAFMALYKIIAGKYQWATDPETMPISSGTRSRSLDFFGDFPGSGIPPI
jgi:hypothetical protein